MTDTERLRRLDRENEELRDMLNQVAWRLGLDDEVHYYSGDNYLACQLRVLDAINGLIERETQPKSDPAADVSVSAYDLLPEEEREAVAWVREYGGLEAVRRMFQDACNRRVELCGVLGIDLDTGWSDATAELDFRLMPSGMEWPRYDTGEPVRIDGAIADELGCVHEVTSVEIFDNGADLRWNPDEPEECVWVGRGERVRRPAPKVLDADGVEVEVGDDLYSVEGMLKFHVSAIDKKSGRIATEAMFALDKWADPKMYTHRAPALAADGRPIREGDTVYEVEGTGHAYKVVGIRVGDGDPLTPTVVTCDVGDGTSEHFLPSQLTHERPERKCRDCAHWQKDPTTTTLGVCWELYGEYEGEDCYPARSKNHVACEEFMPRAKALAERDA